MCVRAYVFAIITACQCVCVCWRVALRGRPILSRTKPLLWARPFYMLERCSSLWKGVQRERARNKHGAAASSSAWLRYEDTWREERSTRVFALHIHLFAPSLHKAPLYGRVYPRDELWLRRLGRQRHGKCVKCVYTLEPCLMGTETWTHCSLERDNRSFVALLGWGEWPGCVPESQSQNHYHTREKFSQITHRGRQTERRSVRLPKLYL